MGNFSFIPTLEVDRFPKLENLLVSTTYASLNGFISIISDFFSDAL